MSEPQFVSAVISGEMLNIPSKFAEHHDIRKGDTVEVAVVSHKRDGEELMEVDQ